MRNRAAALVAASIISGGGAAAWAAAGPPPETSGGAKVSLYASGLDNPTSFAWGDGAMFAGDSGNSQTLPNGGVYVIKHGKATKLAGKVLFGAGMTFHKGVLYVSGGILGKAGPEWVIQAWSGWNGSAFAKQKTVYTAPRGFDGFNGIAFGPDGRLYVAVDLGLTDGNDHAPATAKTPYLYDILSMTTGGKGLKVYASGIRQAWQLAWSGKTLFAGDLGQDRGAKNPPDFLLKVKKGDNYGFPRCNGTNKSRCKGFAKPYRTFSPHFDPMGLAVVGKTLYIGSFLGMNGKGGSLYAMSIKSGKVTPVVTGFPLATDALAAHGGYLYVGGSTPPTATGPGVGLVYRVKP